MFEAIEVIKKLFDASIAGKDVKHQGRFFTLETTRLWTMPETPPPVLVATAGPINAKRTGKFADGIITVGAPLEKIGGLFDKFAEGAREAGKDPDTMPRVLQLHLSWAETDEQALTNAMTEWPNGGMKFAKADIRSPHDFAAMAALVRPEDFEGRMVISADPDVHRAHIQKFVDLGFDRVYLHNVGRNQAEWIEVFGRDVLPKLRAVTARRDRAARRAARRRARRHRPGTVRRHAAGRPRRGRRARRPSRRAGAGRRTARARHPRPRQAVGRARPQGRRRRTPGARPRRARRPAARGHATRCRRAARRRPRRTAWPAARAWSTAG